MNLFRMRILAIVILLSGCAGFPIRNPTEKDLVGSWESVGLVPYAMLEYRIGEKSVLAIGGIEGEVEIATIIKFEPLEDEFCILVKSSVNEEEVTEFIGSIWGGQLALREKGAEEFTIWFSRPEVTKIAKRRVEEAVKKYIEMKNE